MVERWTPQSWRDKPIRQVPDYPDKAALAAVETACEPSAAGVRRRGAQPEASLGQVADGKAFLLQGGDCAESFAESSARQYPRHLPRAAADGGGADLRRRHAGGEGRPHRRPVRQAALATIPRRGTASTLPSYRGDNINGIEFTRRGAHARSAPPDRRPIASRPRR